VRGAHEDAEKAVTRLLSRKPLYPQAVALVRHVADRGERLETVFSSAVRRAQSLRHDRFSSAPWFLQDLGT
jgi:hypothetical protein